MQRLACLAAMAVSAILPMAAFSQDGDETIRRLFQAAEIPFFGMNRSGKVDELSANGQDEADSVTNDHAVFRMILGRNRGTLIFTVTSEGAYAASLDGKRLFACEPGDVFCPLFASGDGESFYAATDWRSDFVSLVKIGLDGGLETVHADPSRRSDLAGVVLYGAGGNDLAAVYYLDDGIRYYFFSPVLAKLHEAAVNLFPDADVLWSAGDASGGLWLCRIMRASQPASWFLFSASWPCPEIVYQSTPLENTVQPQPVRYRTRDGKEASGYLTTPSGDAPHPLVVFIHGGPSDRSYRWFDPRVQALAGGGYAVFQPNYRGSRGFGKEWLRGGWREWGTGTAQNDISDGVKWLIDTGVADSKRVAAFGGSFGGYAALAGLAFTPELYRCGASFFGPSDLAVFIRDNQSPLAGFDKPMFGDKDNPGDMLRLKRQSPLHAEGGIGKPLFLYHGGADALTPVWHSDSVFNLSNSTGNAVEYINHPIAGHGFLDSRHEADTYRRLLDFFARHL